MNRSAHWRPRLLVLFACLCLLAGCAPTPTKSDLGHADWSRGLLVGQAGISDSIGATFQGDMLYAAWATDDPEADAMGLRFAAIDSAATVLLKGVCMSRRRVLFEFSTKSLAWMSQYAAHGCSKQKPKRRLERNVSLNESPEWVCSTHELIGHGSAEGRSEQGSLGCHLSVRMGKACGRQYFGL